MNDQGFQQLPNSEESERAVLAALLLSPALLPMVSNLLVTDDFFLHRHQYIYQAMVDLHKAAKPVDLRLLQAHLEIKGRFEAVGGLAYLTSLDLFLPDIHRTLDYVEVVKERSTRRRLMRISADLTASCMGGGQEAGELLEEASKELSGLRASASVRSAPAFVNDLIDEAANGALARREGVLTGVLTGYRAIDEKCPYGAEPGEVSVIAGWKRHGKSSLALGIAAHAAIALKKQVLYYSTEMNKYDLTYRLLSYWSAVPFRRIKLGELTWDDERRLGRAREQIDDQRSLSFEFGLGGVDKIARIAKSQQLHHGLDLLVVDFLQQLSRPPGRSTGEEQLSTMMRQTKEIAVDLGIPVWLLSQLSTPQEKKSRRVFRPHIDLLKGAGTIGDDAHVAIGVYQPWLDDPNNNDPSKGEIHLMKNKNGETGEVELYWDGPTMAYRDYANREAF